MALVLVLCYAWHNEPRNDLNDILNTSFKGGIEHMGNGKPHCTMQTFGRPKLAF